MALYGGCGCEEYCRHDEQDSNIEVLCPKCSTHAGYFVRFGGEIVCCEECQEIVGQHEMRLELLEAKEAMAYAG